MRLLTNIIKLFTLLSIIIFSQLSFAWNQIGHLVIANISYQYLKPEVKNKVDNLVAIFSQENPEITSYQLMADWMDSLHAKKIEAYSRWHYINYAFSNDGTPLKNLIDTDNVVWAINMAKPIINNTNTDQYDRAEFLAFLSHMVADLHQPLHTVALISSNYPDGDRGGNLYNVFFQGKKIKLHQLWDEGLGYFTGNISSESVKTLSDEITRNYPEGYFGNAINDLDPEHWANEGVSNAQNNVYTTLENQAVSATYVANGIGISQKEAALAGYRLANLLNQLLGDAKK